MLDKLLDILAAICESKWFWSPVVWTFIIIGLMLASYFLFLEGTKFDIFNGDL
jgi:hypothetical protein